MIKRNKKNLNPEKHNHNNFFTSKKVYERRKIDDVGETKRNTPLKGVVPIVRDIALEYSNCREEDFGIKVKASECTLIKKE